jgi:transcriptional regulator GlxA family with amidase domain
MGSDGRKAIDTNKLLREVARRCGWRSERVMSHVFERQLGCSVAVWLKSEQKEL